MTTETIVALAATADARATGGMVHLEALSGPFHVVNRLATLPQALANRRWRQPTLEFAAAAYGAATGKGPARACYCCDRAWTHKRRPALFLLSELWTTGGAQGLVSALCGSCAGKPDLPGRIAAGLKRDLNADPATMRIIEKEGRA